MSADEIRELAEDCRRKSECYGLDTLEHRVEVNKEQALLDYAATLDATAMAERRDRVIESMHMQLLLAAKNKRRTVSIQDLTRYFGHLERILRGEKE